MDGRRPALTPRKRNAIGRVGREILKMVRPTEKEMRTATFYANEIMGRLKEAAPKDVEIILAGSVARGTQVRGSSDIDIFLLFPKSMDERKMEMQGLRIAKGIVNGRRNESYVVKYAEHPYVRLLLNDMNISADIVPAFKIGSAEEMGSAVDRTQLHNLFVNEKLSNRQRDDVRILKTFLNARNIYGAEARVEGFSGYLCELLVHHYGSFAGVLEAFAHAKVPLVVDPLNRGKELQDRAGLVKRFGGSIIVIDPTDRNRNVAANVSGESLGRFIMAAGSFIRNPAKKEFLGTGFSGTDSMAKVNKLEEELGVDLYALCLKVPDMTEDILWQQLKRLRVAILRELDRNGFAALLSLQELGDREALLAFFIKRCENRSAVVRGPSAFMGGAVDLFVKSHQKSVLMYMDSDRVLSLERPRFTKPDKLLRSIISQNNINFPSYISKKRARLYINGMPEHYAKMLYTALQLKMLR